MFPSYYVSIANKTNFMFTIVCEKSPGHELKIDFSNIKCTRLFFGLFNDKGIHGIIDFSDLDSIDHVLMFLS